MVLNWGKIGGSSNRSVNNLNKRKIRKMSVNMKIIYYSDCINVNIEYLDSLNLCMEQSLNCLHFCFAGKGG